MFCSDFPEWLAVSGICSGGLQAGLASPKATEFTSLYLSPQFQTDLSRGRWMKRQKERWLTLSYLRFNYHVGRSAAVITVVNASADLGGIFPSKFLCAPIRSRLSLLVIGLLINLDVMSRCCSAGEDSYTAQQHWPAILPGFFSLFPVWIKSRIDHNTNLWNIAVKKDFNTFFKKSIIKCVKCHGVKSSHGE